MPIEQGFVSASRMLSREMYNPEAQAILIRREQEAGTIHSVQQTLLAIDLYDFDGLEWVRFVCVGETSTFCYKGNCQEQILEQLQPGDPLEIIEGSIPRSDYTNGKPRVPVGAVIARDKGVVFTSPGFKLGEYLKNGNRKFINPDNIRLMI